MASDPPQLTSVAALLEAYGGILDLENLGQVPASAISDLQKYLSQPLLSYVTSGPEHSCWLSRTEPAHFGRLEFVERWSCNAAAAQCREKPVVLFNGGLIVHALNFYSWVLSKHNFLPDYGTQSGTRTPAIGSINLGEIAPLARTLTSDRAGLETSIPNDLQAIVKYIRLSPLCPSGWVRQQLAAKLCRDALNFLLRHELAHVERGHLQFITRRGHCGPIAEFFATGFVEENPAADPALMSAFEVEADSIAAEQMLRQITQSIPSSNSSSSDFVLSRHHLTQKGSSVDLDIENEYLSIEKRISLLVVTIGTLFQLLDYVKRASQLSMISAHPSSEIRLSCVLSSLRAHISGMHGAFADEIRSKWDKATDIALKNLEVSADLLTLPVMRASMLSDQHLGSFHATLASRSKDLVISRNEARNIYFLPDGTQVNISEFHEQNEAIDAYCLLGQTMKFYGEDGEVIKSSTSRLPENADDFVSRGAAWLNVNEIDKGLLDLRYALLMDPGHELGHSILKYALRIQEFGSLESDGFAPSESVSDAVRGIIWDQFDSSVSTLSDLIDHNKIDCAYLLTTRGAVLAQAGRFDAALEDFRLALKQQPNYLYALHNRATALSRNGMFSEAIDDFNRIISIKPINFDAYFGRSGLHYRMEGYDLALADLNYAIILEPYDVGARARRANISIQRRDIESLKKDLALILELAPGSSAGKWATQVIQLVSG